MNLKSDWLIEYNKRNFFFKNHAINEIGRLVQDLFLFLKKLYMMKKKVICSLVSIYFDCPQLGIQ